MTVSEHDVRTFLGLRRLAVVGASDDARNFGNTIYKVLKAHGYDTVAVHPGAATVDGDVAHRNVSDIAPPVDGVVVVVNARAALEVLDDCITAGVKHVWLFRGLGSDGALSAEAVERCRSSGVHVVAGACPLMFLEPVGWVHKVHRGIRHLNRSVTTAA